MFLASPTTSWSLPSMALLEAFTVKFQKTGITVYVPESKVHHGRILQVQKHFRYMKMSKKKNGSPRNLFILSKFGIPVGILNEEKVNFSMTEFQRRSEILYVTTVSSYHSATLNNTLQFLHNNFQKRGNSDKDVWLIGLDISVDTDVDERYAKYCSCGNNCYLSNNIKDYSNSYLCLLRLLQPFLEMKLDIDDDVYIYQVDVQRSVEIYQ